MSDLIFPRVIRVEPASQCNLTCSHCPTGTVDIPRGLMSEAVFDKVLGEIRTHRDVIKVIVLYHGGEPLLAKNFFTMISEIKSISPGFYVKTVSNGMALTAGNSDSLISSGIDCIEFSLDGVSAEENEHIKSQKQNRNHIKKHKVSS